MMPLSIIPTLRCGSTCVTDVCAGLLSADVFQFPGSV